MLYILKEVEGPRFFYLFTGNEYDIGRKKAAIALTNDASISRKHAIIKIGPNSATLKDLESKYGTFHNKLKVTPNTEIVLNDKDIIKLGVYDSKFRIEKIDLVVTGSGLTNEEKVELKGKITSIGGTFLNEWGPTCTHLTAPVIVLTIKMLHALIDDKPIVNLKFWDEYILKIKNNEPLPEPQNFKPPVTETLINGTELKPNPERKVLFKNKIFVFPTEKLRLRMAYLIEKTGGSCISWEKQPLTFAQVTQSKNTYLFIYSDDKNTPQSLKNIYEHLTKIGERTIPLQEIPKAIVLCSCEKDCNPKFNRIFNVFVEKESDSESAIFPLAYETPTDDVFAQTFEPKQELVIPESLDADLHLLTAPPTPNTSKQINNIITPSALKRGAKEPEKTPAKKVKLDESANERKRKADENLGPSPKKNLLENPFAIMRKKIVNRPPEPDNPFVALRVKREVREETDNPFKNIMNNTREKPAEKSSLIKSVQYSADESYCPSDPSNVTWLSKHDIKTESFEPESDFKELFDLFKNTVVIEPLPPTAIRVLPLSQYNSGNTTTGGKNFKKFKKVRPLRPQTDITRTSIYQNMSVQVIPEVVSDNEEEEVIRRPVPKKTNPRRFQF
ncbi:nibrin [Tribolium castaneum]|uniref:Nibrin n=1 Tax=Tribolium castaneum TaxID=7070 RepID=D6WJM6_TRICA|nr:PREDICTED: nibrin [Tribolium castaneum]EFA04568.2 nbs [Tribolium castaneum]|eukprot:XP_008194085.1 PREDICTED: nibrin [Tribolium castaneum]